MKDIKSDVEFANWVSKAKSGDKVKYYGGLLMRDRQIFFTNSAYTGKLTPELSAAKMAWSAFKEGLVLLVQKRRDHCDYDYIAVKA